MRGITHGGDKFLSPPYIIFVLGRHGISHKWQAVGPTIPHHIRSFTKGSFFPQKVFIKDFPEAGGPHFGFQLTFQSQAVVEMPLSATLK